MAFIPYRAYWSTPFCKWQGSFSHLHSMELAAWVARNELKKRAFGPDVFDNVILGLTTIQKQSFYGVPWLTGLMGAGELTGQTVSQACATSARCLVNAAHEVNSGNSAATLVITTDRISNGAHIYYPMPSGPGGTGAHENVVLDNFNCDPYAGEAMLDTAENAAAKWNISTAEQHEVVLRRYQQYQDALADDSAFLRRFMTLPFDVPDARYKKTISMLDGDEGVFPVSAEALARLQPVRPDGSITFGGQTHPADGNSSLVVTTRERARELSGEDSPDIEIIAYGQGRTEKALMPHGPVVATRRALKKAGMSIADMDAIKSHNPFAVNDIVFAREMGVDWNELNHYGCSLIWGHPQGPTGLRSIIELIEELVLRGGGYGLFNGCAAGDSAMAVILKIN